MKSLAKNPPPLIVVTGHYGAGKTTFATKLALAIRETGKSVAIADLDIVNPYFCAVEHEELFAARGITLCASPLKRSGTSMDIPSLTLNIAGVLAQHDVLIIDAGGDPEGAKVLGRYAHEIERSSHDVVCVINAYRHQTQEASQAVQILHATEAASKLKATCLYNNSHLCNETTPEIIAASEPFAQEVAALTALPFVNL